MVVTLTSSGACLIKTGPNVSTKFTSFSDSASLNADTNWTALINQAEARICMISRNNWISNYSILDTVLRTILDDYCSSQAALHAVESEPASYGRTTAADKVNTLRDQTLIMQGMLKDQKGVTTLKGFT